MTTHNPLKGHGLGWAGWVLAAGLAAVSVQAQGLPKESRETIHRLFDGHGAIRRTVTVTADGYEAVTESDDTRLAEALRTHVRQMEERLDAGLWVRRHDPAFVEYIEHREEITHRVESTPKGLRVTVKGKNPKAAAVARNHAEVVSDFAAHGWEAHDRSHAKAGGAKAFTESAAATGTTAPSPATCRMSDGKCCSESGPKRPSRSPRSSDTVRHHP